jgi:hypothetical protein
MTDEISNLLKMLLGAAESNIVQKPTLLLLYYLYAFLVRHKNTKQLSLFLNFRKTYLVKKN